MDMLQVKENQIVNQRGQPVRLRGTCIGGWMNMENFIDGYPGAPHALREAFERELGAERAAFFFERFLHHFFTEDDVIFIRKSGATAIRIPLNYRHFEADSAPFNYLASGFERLDRTVQWCARHGLYAILDLHAVPGCQNPDWHSDNAANDSLFWQHPHFQDRFIALWEEFARRYKGHAAVAGYNVMNEPVTSRGANNRNPFTAPAATDWDALNRLYSRVVKAIRAIDPDHIIYLEGDNYSSLLSGLDAPFAPNLVYSSHNYMWPGLGPGRYPGEGGGARWDQAHVAQAFRSHEGPQYAAKHGVPLWVGEFGAVFNGPPAEIPDRLRGLDDQLAVMEASGAHWSTWTYKDVGVMGWTAVAPDSAYMRAIRPVFEAKLRLHAEGWGWLAPSPMDDALEAMNRLIADSVKAPELTPDSNRGHLAKVALHTYTAGLLQTPFARCFKDMTKAQIDRALESWRFANCVVNEGQAAILRKHMVKTI
jgi:endoglucanase